MKTAVLMATYNGEKFIEKQLDSIKNQVLAPDYVIIRDDGSTDGTVEFVKDYIATNDLVGWNIIKNQKNLGWRLNFRQLLIDSQNTDADVIFLSDQDDVWNLKKIKKQVEVLSSHSEIEVLSSDIEFNVSTDQAAIPKSYVFSDNAKELSKFPINRFYNVGFRQGMSIAMKKEFIDRFIKYWKEDYDLLPHDSLIQALAGLLEVGYNLNETLAIHNRHAMNASGRHDVTLKSPKKFHIQELYAKHQGYYEIAYKVLQDNNSSLAQVEKKYYEFTKRRVANAKSGNLWKVIVQQVKDWKKYEHRSSQIRDILFALKRERKKSNER
ncbi:glycosyltransferase [Lactococcus lactis]|uniref:Glycosyltransferase n=1 Tax=Lactococcus lactis TaxID=1358 RepID=A0A7X1VIH6_9LACT|nr:glycosyltransferase [Lactococcus lactis]MCQ4970502.1 glycosyltransferase [Lactococcus lactis]MCQ4996217.1 glycosyltransferase [Lactococcus lactis]MCT0440260.1 glycosyltransferase [Lactococcus lactis subsp. lactis]MCZ8491485.1 glycosyltransferase [Lactococcus lactis]MDT2858626.1 glycosyltransferase [Lactococcus lactis]